MKTCAAVFVAVWLAISGVARAQLTIAVAPSVQNSASGQSLVFSGTLTNTGTSSELFLNNVAFTLNGNSGTYLVSGSNAFYANVPGILLPGGSYAGPIFGVSLGAGTPPADYTGSVTLQGGTNIFAGTSLASGSFTVLSPAVTLAATTPAAYEYGQVPGTFTITRTGGTEIGLCVSFAIGGTAVDGSDYVTIPAMANIAAGSSSGTVAITPILQQTALGSRSVTLTVQGSALYDLGAPISDTVTIQDTPFNNWRLQNFGASANAVQSVPAADWNGNGIANLVAYALNINPANPNPGLLPVAAISSNYLTLSYAPNPGATDVTYTVQASTDLVNWSSTNVVEVSDSSPGQVMYRYLYPVSSARDVFLRLQVTPLDW